MANYQVTWNADSRLVSVIADNATPFPGFVKIGDYDHGDEGDPIGPEVNHVLYHHIRELFYKLNIEGMQSLKIYVGNVIPDLTISVSPPPAIVGNPYQCVPAVVGGTSPYSFALTNGTLIPNLVFNETTGVISGTPTLAGTINGYRIRVTDANGLSAETAPFSIAVSSVSIPAPVNDVLPTISGSPVVGKSINETMTFGNGTWSGIVNQYTNQIILGGVVVSGGYIWKDTDAGKTLINRVIAYGPSDFTTADSLTREVIFGVVVKNITMPAVIGTDTEDGTPNTLSYGEWENVDAIQVQFMLDNTEVSDGLYNLDYGDPDPVRNYNYAANAGRFRWIKVTGIHLASGNRLTVASPVRLGVYNDVVLNTTFTGTAGALLKNQPGWSSNGTIYGHNSLKIANPGVTIDFPFNTLGQAQTLYEAGGQASLEIEPWFNPEDVTVSDKTRAYLMLRTTDTSLIYFGPQGNGYEIKERIDGVETWAGSGFGHTVVNGDKWRTKINRSGGNRYIQLEYYSSVAGTWSPAIVSFGNYNGGLGFGPINPILTGTKIGIGSGNVIVQPGKHTKSLIVRVPNTNTISLAVSEPIISPDNTSKQRVVLTGSYVLPDNELEWSLISADGTILVNWSGMTGAVAGDYSFTTDIDYRNGGIGTFLVRGKNSPTTAVSKSIELLVLPDVAPLVIGLNVGDLKAGQVTNNLMMTFGVSFMNSYFLEVDTSTSSTGPTGFNVNSIGFPTEIPSDRTYVELFRDYQWPTELTSDAFGDYVWEFDPDLVFTTSGQGTVLLSKDQAAGRAIIREDASILAGSGILPYVRITQFPADPEKCYIRAYKAGSTEIQKEQFLRPQANSYYAKFGALRDMDIIHTNREYNHKIITPDMLSINDSWSERVRRASLQQILNMGRQTGTIIHHNLHDMMNGPSIRAFATNLISKLLPGEKILIEWSNEPWNSGFWAFHHNARSAFNFKTGKKALVEGDYIKGAASGLVVQISAQKILTGTVGASNADGYILVVTDCSSRKTSLVVNPWNMLYGPDEVLHRCDKDGNILDNAIAVFKPQDDQPNFHIAYARKVAWVIEQLESVVGPIKDSPIEMVCAWQSAGNTITFGEMLKEQNLGQKITHFMWAPYGRDFGNYRDTQYMSKADRDKALTDPAGYKTALAAAMTVTAKLSTDMHNSNVLWLANFQVDELGLPKGSIISGTYENAPQHLIEVNTPFLQFSNGSAASQLLTDGDISGKLYVLRGRTSGCKIRIGAEAGGYATTRTSGTFAAGNAVGYVTKGNQWSGTPVVGEVCDLYRYNGQGIDSTDKVADAVLTITGLNDIQSPTRAAWSSFWNTPEFGNIYKTYLTNLTVYGGHHFIFTGHGRTADLWNYGDWGRWNISEFVENLNQYPLKSILEWID